MTASSPALIADRFAVDEMDESVGAPEADYNVAPRREVMVVREREDRRVLSRLRWGLVPSWAQDVKIGDRLINARAETVAAKPSYRRAFAKKRCLIPADGFYEWQAGSPRAKKQPFFIHRRDGEPLAFAGLWEVWKVPDEERETIGGPDGWLRTCVILTTTANSVMEPIHNRMPVILPESAWARWLDPEEHDVDALAKLLVPAPAEVLEAYPVSTDVNNARKNTPELAHSIQA